MDTPNREHTSGIPSPGGGTGFRADGIATVVLVKRMLRPTLVKVAASVGIVMVIWIGYVQARKLIRRVSVPIVSEYVVEAVKRTNVIEELSVAGTLYPDTSVFVKAIESGIVAEVNVNEGQAVTKGQLLGKMDERFLRQEIEKAEENLAESENRVEDFRRELAACKEQNLLEDTSFKNKILALSEAARRMRTLYENGAASLHEYEEACLKLEEAEGALRVFEARARAKESGLETELARAERELKDCDAHVNLLTKDKEKLAIRAPAQGGVTQCLVMSGSAVSVGTDLFEVTDMDSLKVRIDVPENEIGKVRVGQRATVEIWGSAYQGEVESIAPRTERRTSQGAAQGVEQVVSAMIRFERADREFEQDDSGQTRLHSGMSARVRIEIGRLDDVLTLPRGPYLAHADGFVFVVEGDMAYKRDVSLQLASAQHVLVRGGLSEGDTVIISGYMDYKDRDEVRLAGR